MSSRTRIRHSTYGIRAAGRASLATRTVHTGVRKITTAGFRPRSALRATRFRLMKTGPISHASDGGRSLQWRKIDAESRNGSKRFGLTIGKAHVGNQDTNTTQTCRLL